MPYSYRVTLERLLTETPKDEGQCITFDVSNHDELFQLIERVATLGVVPKEETAEFMIGLKLFSEVMLRHRHEPLFADLFGHFATFMKRLKNVPPAGSTPE